MEAFCIPGLKGLPHRLDSGAVHWSPSHGGLFHAHMGPSEQEPTWTGTRNENVDEPQGTQDASTDWEAKYREAVAQSRKWEDRVKASFADSEELKKLKEAQMSDAEKTAKRIAELEQENAGYKAARQQEQWRAQVAKKTGCRPMCCAARVWRKSRRTPRPSNRDHPRACGNTISH